MEKTKIRMTWQCGDGAVFHTEAEAVLYQEKLELTELLKEKVQAMYSWELERTVEVITEAYRLVPRNLEEAEEEPEFKDLSDDSDEI